MEKGLVFNIQRFSIHDGPGIRTTVFLKGCNLKCFWCHNPESLNAKSELMVFNDKCIGCMSCVSACKNKAFVLSGCTRIHNRELCTACGKCVEICCSSALAISGKVMESGDVLDEILKDKDFYQVSGGGVTVSGGEPLLQKNFVKELFSKCASNGIHTAIETNLSTHFSEFEDLLPTTDLVLVDIKAMDDKIHLKATGTSNVRILENVQRLSYEKMPFIIRIPVIPGVSDNEENIRATAEFAKNFQNLIFIELMPFHNMANAKYKSLGMNNLADTLKILSDERIGRLKQVAEDVGVRVC